MYLVLGIALLAAAGFAILGARPPAGQAMHPRLRGRSLVQAVYPPLCLALVTFGVALILAGMPDL